jgi:integrase
MYNYVRPPDTPKRLERAKMEIINARIFARGNIWYMEYETIFENIEQKRIQTSTKVKTSEKDRDYMVYKFLPAKIAQICQASKIKELDKYEFGFYFDAYCRQNSSKASFGNKLKPRALKALSYFGKAKDVRTITKFDVKEYLLKLTDSKTVKRETLKGYIDVLANVLELAVDKGVIDKNSAIGIKVEGQNTKNENSTKPFIPKEVNKLLQTATSDMRNYLGVGFHTGMSPEEILGLMPQDIDFENSLIKICRVITSGELKQGTKTVYRTREIPLFKTVKPYILAQLEIARQRHSLYLFCNENGTRLDDVRDMRGQKKNNTKWWGLLRECGLEERPLKNTRHTFAVNAIKSGKFTLQQVADILGHSSLKMLILHYAKYINGSAKEANSQVDLYEQVTDTFTDTSIIAKVQTAI